MAARPDLKDGDNMERSQRYLLIENLAVEERRVAIGGVETSLLEGGHGPPMILLHGGIQVGGVIWWRVIAKLAETYRLVIPDLPGLGESPPPPRPLGTDTVLAWLEGLVDQTTDQPPILVAHSLLGVFAIRYAIEHGHRLRRLVLVATPGLGPFRPKPSLVLALMASMIRPSPGRLNRFMGRIMYDRDSVEQEEGKRWRAFMDYLGALATLPAVRQTMRQIPRGNLGAFPGEELRAISTPTTLIWGEHDPNTRRRFAEQAAETLNWPLHVVEQAGHIPHVERPTAFIEAVRSSTDTPSLGR